MPDRRPGCRLVRADGGSVAVAPVVKTPRASPLRLNKGRLVPSGLRMPDVHYARCYAQQAPVSSRAVVCAVRMHPRGQCGVGTPAVRPHAAPGRYSPAANAAGRDIRAADVYLHGWTGSRAAMSVVE